VKDVGAPRSFLPHTPPSPGKPTGDETVRRRRRPRSDSPSGVRPAGHSRHHAKGIAEAIATQPVRGGAPVDSLDVPQDVLGLAAHRGGGVRRAVEDDGNGRGPVRVVGGVHPRTAVEDVPAGASVQHVAGAIADQGVRQGVAPAVDGDRSHQRQGFEVRTQRVGNSRPDTVPRIRIVVVVRLVALDNHVVPGVDAVDIRAIASLHRVVAGAAIQQVPGVSAAEMVVSRSTEKLGVFSLPAFDAVVAAASVQDVARRSAGDGVVAEATVDEVGMKEGPLQFIVPPVSEHLDGFGVRKDVARSQLVGRVGPFVDSRHASSLGHGPRHPLSCNPGGCTGLCWVPVEFSSRTRRTAQMDALAWHRGHASGERCSRGARGSGPGSAGRPCKAGVAGHGSACRGLPRSDRRTVERLDPAQIRTKSALVRARLVPSTAISTEPPAALPFES